MTARTRRLIALLRSEVDGSRTHEPSVATTLLALGETEAAFEWLESRFRIRGDFRDQPASDRVSR